MNPELRRTPPPPAVPAIPAVPAPLWASVPQRALRQNVLRSLLTAIVKGQLAEGHWLNAQKLAEEFGVSATPVREALVELATIGVVEMQHNRGTIIRRFGPTELLEVYQLRGVLEAEATRCACPHIPIPDLQRLRQQMTALLKKRGADWSERAWEIDREFHALIASHSGNRRLAEEISRYRTLMQSIREAVGNQYYAQDNALKEHLAIIRLLLQRQGERAAEAMRQHILSTADSARKALFPETDVKPKPAAK
jgi:DNA-binding GntR family transcriptional regulator